MKLRPWLIFTASLPLTACSGVFDSDLAAPQAYLLRLPPGPAPEPGATAGRIVVQRPEASPGLESERIALLRSEHRFDFYAASRWAAPAPDIVESVIIDTLRATGAFAAVLDDSAAFAGRYSLRCTLRRFEADYTAGSGAPTVFVTLDCTLGRRRDRELLGSFTAQGSARAAEDRLNSVVAAFEAATAAAMSELGRAATAAVANEKTETEKPADGKPPSEGR